MSTTILIIGGYGNTGVLIAGLLLKHAPGVNLVIAGRNLNKARQLSAQLLREYRGRKVEAMAFDIRDLPQLADLMCRADFVINASSTVGLTKITAQALLNAEKDYLDTQLSSPEKLEVLKNYAPDFANKGMTVITDGGFHPGVPAALIRFLGLDAAELIRANVYAALKVDWNSFDFSENTLAEFLHEFKYYQARVFQNKKWTTFPWWKVVAHNFGPPFGKQYCAPMFLDELQEIPGLLPNLEETGFYVSGSNPVMDYFVFPLILAGTKLMPQNQHKWLSRLFLWGATFSKPPFGVKLDAQARGIKNGKQVNLSASLFHEDGYFLTAAPVVACLLQYLDGLRKPGLQFQANFVDPARFLDDLQIMGVEVTV